MKHLVRLAASLCMVAVAGTSSAASLTPPARPIIPSTLVLISSSADFDRDCPAYYRQGNDPDVAVEAAGDHCACLAEWFAGDGLGADALDFFARTYSDDLTTFIQDYPDGEAWMDRSFKADEVCKAQ
jgi:hypothetical protein